MSLKLNRMWQALLVIAINTNCVAMSLPRVVGSFGGECSGPNLVTSISVRRLIENKRKRLNAICRNSSCNEAFSFDLNGDGNPEQFVRLACGATGNCTWGIYQQNPARKIGQFTAWFFYIHKRQSAWSLLSTYTREGGEQGEIIRLAFRKSAYHQIYQRTEQGDYYDHQPFLTKMGIPKCR